MIFQKYFSSLSFTASSTNGGWPLVCVWSQTWPKYATFLFLTSVILPTLKLFSNDNKTYNFYTILFLCYVVNAKEYSRPTRCEMVNLTRMNICNTKEVAGCWEPCSLAIWGYHVIAQIKLLWRKHVPHLASSNKERTWCLKGISMSGIKNVGLGSLFSRDERDTSYYPNRVYLSCVY